MAGTTPATCTYHGTTPIRATLSTKNVVLLPGKEFTLSFAAANAYFTKMVTKGAITVDSGTLIIPEGD